MTLEFYNMPTAYLAPLSQFNFIIDFDPPICDHGLRHPSAGA